MAAEKIFTQEEFDHFIGERLAKAEAKHTEATAELQRRVEALEGEKTELLKTITDNKEKYATYDKTIEELNAKVKGYETDSVKTAIAHELGVPFELKQFLSGDNEEEIRKSAELLSKHTAKNTPTITPPQKNTEPVEKNDSKSAMRTFASNLFD